MIRLGKGRGFRRLRYPDRRALEYIRYRIEAVIAQTITIHSWFLCEKSTIIALTIQLYPLANVADQQSVSSPKLTTADRVGVALLGDLSRRDPLISLVRKWFRGSRVTRFDICGRRLWRSRAAYILFVFLIPFLLLWLRGDATIQHSGNAITKPMSMSCVFDIDFSARTTFLEQLHRLSRSSSQKV